MILCFTSHVPVDKLIHISGLQTNQKWNQGFNCFKKIYYRSWIRDVFCTQRVEYYITQAGMQNIISKHDCGR